VQKPGYFCHVVTDSDFIRNQEERQSKIAWLITKSLLSQKWS